MPRFCASCGSLVAEGALACASCGATVGQSVGGGAAPATATTGLTESLAGALAYVTFLPALFFLVFEPTTRIHSCASTPSSAFSNRRLGRSVVRIKPCSVPQSSGPVSLFASRFSLESPLDCPYPSGVSGTHIQVPLIGDLAEKRANNA